MYFSKKYLLPFLLVCAAGLEEILAQQSESVLSAFGLGRRGPRRRIPGRRPRRFQKCDLRNDHYNPFYWQDQQNICSDEICKANPLLHCNVTRDYIMDQAVAHHPEDLLTEIEAMEAYFYTFFPKPKNILPYSCRGVCEMGDTKHPRDPQEVTRVFANIETQIGYTGKYKKKRLLCHIIGPKIFAHQCGGPCRLPFRFGNQGALQCVADSQVTVDAWAFCPGTYPACRKIPVTVPLSCSCQKLKCLKKLPKFQEFHPILPDMTDISLDPFAPPIADVFGQSEQGGFPPFVDGLGPGGPDSSLQLGDIFGPDFGLEGPGIFSLGPEAHANDVTGGATGPFVDQALGQAVAADVSLGMVDPSLLGVAKGPGSTSSNIGGGGTNIDLTSMGGLGIDLSSGIRGIDGIGPFPLAGSPPQRGRGRHIGRRRQPARSGGDPHIH